ncbi:acyltransferase [Neobacillus notoginsengisoli]|uniref:Acyltransferase n=1 Tax=Neobacillus notoginsengisoli TaxID=1578198 RepID=A0A417YRG9_9BACI|nr:acyltransferase [Neobacillus notoginsengisoli]RHW37260.1 acyltransferase [Neobacillus notoginsengisoli]
MKKAGYIFEIHYLRAVACLMVLLVHVSGSFYYENGKVWDNMTFFVNQISRFGTSMFALISAFLLIRSTINRGFEPKRFFSSRLTKVGLPFLAWSLFYLYYWYVTNGFHPLDSGRKRFIIDFFFGNSFYHLYFMSIVFQFYLVFPLLQLIRSKKAWAVLLVIAALVHIYFLTYYAPGKFEGVWRTILSQRAFLPNWIYFFIFGGFLAYFWDDALSFSRKYAKWFGIASLFVIFLGVLEYTVVGSIPSNRLTNIINIPILTFTMIGFGERISKLRWLSKFLTSIGTYSMAIYLAHPFVLNVFQNFAPQGIWKTPLFPFVFAIVLFLTMGFVKVIQVLPFYQYVLTIPKIKREKVA